jgi:hypothetical protein
MISTNRNIDFKPFKQLDKLMAFILLGLHRGREQIARENNYIHGISPLAKNLQKPRAPLKLINIIKMYYSK